LRGLPWCEVFLCDERVGARDFLNDTTARSSYSGIAQCSANEKNGVDFDGEEIAGASGFLTLTLTVILLSVS